MNICLVGYGAIAQNHMEALSRLGAVNPRFLVGPRSEPRRAFAEQWKFQHHDAELDDALDDAEVDAVVITSPSALHAPQARAALQAGKHVLLEIPAALDAQEVQQLAQLARRVDRRLMICHTMRYMAAMQHVRGMVRTGQFRLHQIVGFFGTSRRNNTTAAGNPRSWTDNILWHHGAHLVDLAMWMTDCREAGRIACRFGPPHPTQGIMDMTLTMTLTGGVLATVTQSYNLSRFRWRVLFIGEEDTLEFDAGELTDAAGKVIVPRQSIVDLHEQDREFIAAVNEGRDPTTTAEDVLPAMYTLQAAQADAERT